MTVLQCLSNQLTDYLDPGNTIGVIVEINDSGQFSIACPTDMSYGILLDILV